QAEDGIRDFHVTGVQTCALPISDVARNARRRKGAKPISPVALEAVKRIDALFAIEREINGFSAAERFAVRQEKSKPLLGEMEKRSAERRVGREGRTGGRRERIRE